MSRFDLDGIDPEIASRYARALEDERDEIDTHPTHEETVEYRRRLRSLWLDSEEGLCPRSISA